MIDWRANWVAYQTLVVREVRRFMRIWLQTLTPPVINALLYMLIFGNLIGSQLREMGGHSYMDFIVPGLIMMSVIVSSYSNVVASFFSAKYQHYIEELLVAPVHNATIVAGYVTGGICRGLLVGLLVSLVSLFFSQLAPAHLIVTILVSVATATLFALGGLINAVFARRFDDTTIITNFVLTPLTYLGGIFFSIDFLPAFWQKVSLFNPVLYMINGFRFGILGSSDIPVGVTFAVILGLIVVLGWFAMYLLNKGTGIKQ